MSAAGMPRDRQVPHLVAHERPQWCDDEGERAGPGGGELVAHGLAAAGGHHGHDVAARDDRPDGLLLARAERVEPEIALQRGQHVIPVPDHSASLLFTHKFDTLKYSIFIALCWGVIPGYRRPRAHSRVYGAEAGWHGDRSGRLWFRHAFAFGDGGG